MESHMNHKAINFLRPRALLFGLLLFSLGAGAPPAPSSPPVAPSGPAGDNDIPKVNTDGMTPSERDALRRFLQKFPSACGKPHSLITSLRTDPKCALSVHAARYLAKLFSDGFLESEVEEKYTRRFIESKCYQIDTAGAQ